MDAYEHSIAIYFLFLKHTAINFQHKKYHESLYFVQAEKYPSVDTVYLTYKRVILYNKECNCFKLV